MLAPSASLFSGPVPYRPAVPHPPTLEPRARRPPMTVSPVPPGFAAALRRAGHLPPRLREALALACDDGRAIRTVEKLAAAAGCDRRTLWTHWKNAVNDRTGADLRLQDFLHWVLLLRAAQRKRPSLAWADVADELGIHPHTLSRLARQLTGAPLRELASGGHGALSVRFEAEVAAPLLGDGARPA